MQRTVAVMQRMSALALVGWLAVAACGSDVDTQRPYQGEPGLEGPRGPRGTQGPAGPRGEVGYSCRGFVWKDAVGQVVGTSSTPDATRLCYQAPATPDTPSELFLWVVDITDPAQPVVTTMESAQVVEQDLFFTSSDFCDVIKTQLSLAQPATWNRPGVYVDLSAIVRGVAYPFGQFPADQQQQQLYIGVPTRITPERRIVVSVAGMRDCGLAMEAPVELAEAARPHLLFIAKPSLSVTLPLHVEYDPS